MLVISRLETDPCFNLAAEEFFLKNKSEDYFMTWIDDPCIVVGKHQNAMAEINYPLVMEHRIPVIRRISGGGTVYHDRGNLNYSFIMSAGRENLVDYRTYTEPVISFLNSLGVNARLTGTSNLVTDGYKFSGNSATVHKNRVLHHGTILFSTDLVRLNEILNPGPAQYDGAAIKSKRAAVANLDMILVTAMTLQKFREQFEEYVMNRSTGCEAVEIGDSDRKSILDLAQDKYSSWEWNFGWSPDYSVASLYREGSSEWLFDLTVSKGIIKEAKITELESGETHDSFVQAIKGLRHCWKEMKPALENINFGQYLGTQGVDKLIHYLF
jgi:lipoate-protein ligase A